MLSIQAVRGLPRLHAPGIVLALSLSRGNSLISSWCDHSMLASLPWQQFPVYSSFVKNPLICFLCFPWNPHNLFSPFISEASRHVSSFFLRVQLSQPYVATGHTSAFISRIFVEISMLWLFHFFAVTVLKTGLQDAVKHGGIIEGRGSVGDARFLFQLSSDEPTRLRNKFRMSQVSREDYLRSS